MAEIMQADCTSSRQTWFNQWFLKLFWKQKSAH